MALQFNWILVAALEDYHAELPDGSRNKKANTVYFNRCAKLLQVGCGRTDLLGAEWRNSDAWHGLRASYRLYVAGRSRDRYVFLRNPCSRHGIRYIWAHYE